MAENSIKQLTFARGDGRCPVCGKMLQQNKHFLVELHNLTKEEFVNQRCELLYCDNCELPLVDGRILASLYEKTGMRPTTFSTAKGKLTGIKSQMYYKKKVSSPVSKHSNSKGYKVIGKSTSIWKPYTRLYTYTGEHSCPKCQQPFFKGETIIPTGEETNLLVEGFICPKCRSMYIRDTDNISRIMKDNPNSAGFYINDTAYWQYSELKRKKKQEEKRRQKIEEARKEKETQRRRNKNILDSIESSVVLISVMFQDRSTAEYIITTSNTSVPVDNAVHYSSSIGRELLTAAYVQKRKKRGTLNGKKYRVFSVYEKSKMPETIIPTFITIKPDGGYSSSVKNNNCELIDLLLYSPYYDRYECVHATYDKGEDVCFMDVCIYRRFIREYGNPGLWLDFPMSTSARVGELNEESILKGYGYSVAKKENLSSTERKDLLAELVDLEILTVAKIAHHLDFCIHLHIEPQYTEAVSRWESDKSFIENYKVNPDRFMLSK